MAAIEEEEVRKKKQPPTLFSFRVELRQMQMFATVPFMKAAAAVREGNLFRIWRELGAIEKGK